MRDHLSEAGTLAESVPTSGRRPEEAVKLLGFLGGQCYAAGRYGEGEPFLRKALTIQDREPDRPETAILLNNLAMLLAAKGDYQAAEPLYRRAILIQQKLLGPEDPQTAMSLSNLAVLIQAKGQYAEAEQLFRDVLSIRERALGTVSSPVRWTSTMDGGLHGVTHASRKLTQLLLPPL